MKKIAKSFVVSSPLRADKKMKKLIIALLASQILIANCGILGVLSKRSFAINSFEHNELSVPCLSDSDSLI